MGDAPQSGEPVVIDGEQTIKNSAALHGVLQAIYDAGAPVAIDAGSLQTIDTAALQLLTAFVNSMRARQHDVSWVAVSDRLREPARRLGLVEQLQLDAAPSDPDELCPVF